MLFHCISAPNVQCTCTGTEHKELVYSDAETYNENAILKILKWLSNKTATLHQTLTESLLQGEDCSFLSDAQLLVTLLRALGLRVRLVMVLNPIPFKERKSSNKRKSVESGEQTVVSREGKEGEEQMELTVELDAPSSKETKPSGKRKRKDCHEKSQSKSGNDEGKADDGGTNKTTTGTMGKKRRQSTNEGSSSSCAGRQTQKRTRKRSQATKQQRQGSTSTSSPYFKKQARHRSTSSSRDVEEEDPGNLEQSMSKQSSGSDSEYVPEKDKPKKRNLSASFEGIGDDDDEDDDFQQPKKKRRRSSSKLAGATPSKKLKQAADEKAKVEVQSKPLKSSSKTATSRRKSKLTTTSDDSKGGDSNQAREGGSKSHSKPVALHVEGKDANLTAASNSDTNQSRGSSLESVEIVKSEETACWAEVYLTVAGHGGQEGRMRGEGEKEEKAKRWICVHLPSCSMDQPHLCEKHCTIPLHYVIAVENGELID